MTDDTHKYLKWLQAILYNKYDMDIHIRDILDYIVKDGDIKDVECIAKRIAGRHIENENIIKEWRLIIMNGDKYGNQYYKKTIGGD